MGKLRPLQLSMQGLSRSFAFYGVFCKIFMESIKKQKVKNLQFSLKIYKKLFFFLFLPFCLSTFERKILRDMQQSDSKKAYPEIKADGKCLMCGKILSYASRSDKKFCSCGCKNMYHNSKRRELGRCRVHMLRMIEGNYRLLEKCIQAGITKINIADAEAMGFNPHFISSQRKVGAHMEFSCFDVGFRVSESRIFDIHRISLHSF